MVRRHGYIPHRPGPPAVYVVDSGELPLVEVDVEHAAHLAGVLHAKGGEHVVLFRCDGLPVREQLDELTDNVMELKAANSAIADSIQTISAVSEEVSAHSSQTLNQENENTEILKRIDSKMQELIKLTDNR